MAKKRKYTKKDAEYWNSRSSSTNSSKPLVESQAEWEPSISYSTESDVVKKRFSRSSSRSGETSTRLNRVARSKTPDELKNISDLSLPYVSEKGMINARDAIQLCQKTYANIGIFKNTIDIMTEFSNASLYLSGGNKTSRSFISKWLTKINVEGLTEQFFREYYRSGNVFLYKFDSKFSAEDIVKIKRAYSGAASKLTLPVRYIILNPADITMKESINNDISLYQKALSRYEVSRLRNRETDEEKDFFNSLPLDIQKLIDSGMGDDISIPLKSSRLFAVFYKKQDYETFATPFGFPALKDINLKMELKKIDQAMSRTIQQVVLLVTMGSEPEKGGINAKAMQAMRGLLENETVGRTIVSDFSTKMEFVIPRIEEILSPKKYEIVNQDIQDSLQNLIFSKDEKFANQNVKVKVFLERLREGRKAFLNFFLQTEIRKVCKEMGFRKVPEAKFQEVDLKDEVQTNRIYLRLLELGILDADQTFKAMETGILPDKGEMKDAQEKYIEDRKKGLYNPLLGGQDPNSEKPSEKGAPNPNTNDNGRPAGSTGPRNVTSSSLFGLKKIKATLQEASSLINSSEASLKRKYKLKKLDEDQKVFAFNLAKSVMLSEKKDNWKKALTNIMRKPEELIKDKYNQQSNAIDGLSSLYSIDEFEAALLYHSELTDKEKEKLGGSK